MCYKDVKEGIQIKEVQEINQLEEIKLLKQDKKRARFQFGQR